MAQGHIAFWVGTSGLFSKSAGPRKKRVALCYILVAQNSTFKANCSCDWVQFSYRRSAFSKQFADG